VNCTKPIGPLPMAMVIATALSTTQQHFVRVPRVCYLEFANLIKQGSVKTYAVTV
jgi:hypothetical protein